MGVKAIAEAIQSVLEGLNDGATPTPNYYFDQVWIGEPTKIPMGNDLVAVVEAYMSPNFYYTTCAANTLKDTDFYISILSKGSPEVASLRCYEMTDIVLTALYSNPKISGTCGDSSVEEIAFGTYGEPEGKLLISGSRITLRCKE